MSDKTIKSLTGFLAGLLCLYGIVLWSTRTLKGKAVYQGRPEEIQKLQIEKPGENHFVIERATGGWVLTEPVHARANQKSVEDFVAGIPIIVLEEVISSRSEKHSAFQITDEEAVHILAYSAGTGDQPVFDLLFGKTAPGGSKYFVRLPGQDDVYIAGGVPIGVVNRDLSSWRDKKIFPFHRDEMVRVQYRKAGNILLFEEQGGILEGQREKWGCDKS